MQKIYIYNPWYKKKNFKYKNLPLKRRNIFFDIKKYLQKKIIISISGLRRLGKTTIIKQLINDFLQTKIKKKFLFFYSFSETDHDLTSILNYYFENICQEDLYSVKVNIFLDELQYVKNWQETLKFYYDINPHISFVITGSSSLNLHKNTKESLAGRIIDFRINPLSFQENLYLKYNVKQFEYDLFENNFFLKFKKAESDFLPYKNEFFQYLIKGEFPEIIKEKDANFIFDYLSNSVIDKIFNKDISLFEVNKKKEFLLLYKIAAQNCAQMINKTNIATEIALNFKTVSSYLHIQKQAFLIYLIPNYLRSIRSQEKSYKKVFISSINLLLNILKIDNFSNIPFIDFAGHVIENYVFNALKNRKNRNMYFYYKNSKEVDLILEKGQVLVPMKIKYKKTFKKSDINSLISFCKEKNCKYGLYVYRGECRQEKIQGFDIYFIPYWLL